MPNLMVIHTWRRSKALPTPRLILTLFLLALRKKKKENGSGSRQGKPGNVNLGEACTADLYFFPRMAQTEELQRVLEAATLKNSQMKAVFTEAVHRMETAERDLAGRDARIALLETQLARSTDAMSAAAVSDGRERTSCGEFRLNFTVFVSARPSWRRHWPEQKRPRQREYASFYCELRVCHSRTFFTIFSFAAITARPKRQTT